MSDLISRKAVLDKLKDFSDMYTLEEEARIVLEAIVRIVTEQPTAYDVEKVVAELEEEREYSYADFEEYVQEKSPCLDAEYDDYFHRGLERAVVIVKRGGRE